MSKAGRLRCEKLCFYSASAQRLHKSFQTVHALAEHVVAVAVGDPQEALGAEAAARRLLMQM